MLDFLIFAAGSLTKHARDQYEKLSPEEREALKKDLLELKDTAVEKGKSFIEAVKKRNSKFDM